MLVNLFIIFSKYLNATSFLVSSGVDNYLDKSLADYQLTNFSDIVPFVVENS